MTMAATMTTEKGILREVLGEAARQQAQRARNEESAAHVPAALDTDPLYPGGLPNA